jgi:hypothetical protein
MNGNEDGIARMLKGIEFIIFMNLLVNASNHVE